jgi:hypothetical protein
MSNAKRQENKEILGKLWSNRPSCREFKTTGAATQYIEATADDLPRHRNRWF